MEDYSIKCSGAEREGWLVYAGIMVAIFPIGINVFFTVLLYKQRENLGAKGDDGNLRPWKFMFVYDKAWTTMTDEQMISRVYEEGNDAASLAFLTYAYEPRTFWWIIPENTRRLFLSSALMIFAPESKSTGTAPQAVAALLIC